MTTNHTIQIPPRFYEDHRDRCNSEDQLPQGIRKGSRIEVTLDTDSLLSLYSDSAYYSCYEDLDRDFHGLVRSAIATRRAILKQIDFDSLGDEVAAKIARADKVFGRLR